MLCQNCHQYPANTFISRTVGGHTTQLHLCSKCAKELAFDKMPFLGFDLPQAQPSRRACPSCGATLDAITSTGLLGCPSCYTFFEKDLSAAITRSHGNVTHVSGEAPPTPQKSRREELEEELHKAIADENFEQAALLRDRIKALKKEDEQ